MSFLEILLGGTTLALTIAGGYMALRLRPLEREDDLLSKRITELHDDIKEQQEKHERRLIEIEKSYLSRADLTAAIRDMRENFDKGIERVEVVIRALGMKVDHLAERVGKVEGAG